MDILVLGKFPVSISAGYSLRREDDHPTEDALLAKVGVMPNFYEKRQLLHLNEISAALHSGRGKRHIQEIAMCYMIGSASAFGLIRE